MVEGYEERAHKQIQIESWSNSARTLNLRGATPGGPFAESHVTNADRSKATDTYEIHGIPTRLQVSPQTAPVRRGECYVRVTLLLDGEPVQRLSSGYLTDSKTMSWPPGHYESFTDGPGLIRTVIGTKPAAGAEISEAVPSNAKWKLKAIRIVLTTDATAANRILTLLLKTGINVKLSIRLGLNHTANKAWGYSFSPDLPDITTVRGTYVSTPMPEIDLFQADTIGTDTTNIAGGDEFEAVILTLEEWIEE